MELPEFEVEIEGRSWSDSVLIYRRGQYVAYGNRRHGSRDNWMIEVPARLAAAQPKAGFAGAEALAKWVEEKMKSAGYTDYRVALIESDTSSLDLHEARREWECEGNHRSQHAPGCAGWIYPGELFYGTTGVYGQHTCQVCALILYSQTVRLRAPEPQPDGHEQLVAWGNRWWAKHGLHVQQLGREDKAKRPAERPTLEISTRFVVNIGDRFATPAKEVGGVFRLKGNDAKPWRVEGKSGQFVTAIEALNALPAVQNYRPPKGFQLTNDGRSRYSLDIENHVANQTSNGGS